jgi:hypothetical protein
MGKRVVAAPGSRGVRTVENGDEKRTGWKSRIIREGKEYALNFVYLGFFFGVFTWYRRLVLAEYGISYLHYGIGVVEALILAKIIMIGDVLRLSRKIENKPLILPTLYNTFLFGLWVAVFGVCEHILLGVLHGKGLTGGVHELMSQGKYEVLARVLVVFVAFIPFFAFREMERVLGEGFISGLFFRRRSAQDHRE